VSSSAASRRFPAPHTLSPRATMLPRLLSRFVTRPLSKRQLLGGWDILLGWAGVRRGAMQIHQVPFACSFIFYLRMQCNNDTKGQGTCTICMIVCPRNLNYFNQPKEGKSCSQRGQQMTHTGLLLNTPESLVRTAIRIKFIRRWV
jgi:hypothetical protein